MLKDFVASSQVAALFALNVRVAFWMVITRAPFTVASPFLFQISTGKCVVDEELSPVIARVDALLVSKCRQASKTGIIGSALSCARRRRRSARATRAVAADRILFKYRATQLSFNRIGHEPFVASETTQAGWRTLGASTSEVNAISHIFEA